jgi:hypothetical protein
MYDHEFAETGPEQGTTRDPDAYQGDTAADPHRLGTNRDADAAEYDYDDLR